MAIAAGIIKLVANPPPIIIQYRITKLGNQRVTKNGDKRRRR